MKYTEEERKEIAQARIKREQQRATTEKIVTKIQSDLEKCLDEKAIA